MSEAGKEVKTTVILAPDAMRALMRVGLKLSNGYGMAKTTLIRMAVMEFLERNNEPVVRYAGPL